MAGIDEADETREKSSSGIRGKAADRRVVSVGDTALWDAQHGVFRVKVNGNRDVGSITILRSAPLPIGHLDDSTPARQTKLGDLLRGRLEVEVNAAIQRGARLVPDSLILVGREDSDLS